MWDPGDQWKKCIGYSGKLTAVTNANSHLAKWTRPEITIFGFWVEKENTCQLLRKYIFPDKLVQYLTGQVDCNSCSKLPGSQTISSYRVITG